MFIFGELHDVMGADLQGSIIITVISNNKIVFELHGAQVQNRETDTIEDFSKCS